MSLKLLTKCVQRNDNTAIATLFFKITYVLYIDNKIIEFISDYYS